MIPGCLYFGIFLMFIIWNLTEYTICCYETAPNQGNKGLKKRKKELFFFVGADCWEKGVGQRQ